MSKLNDDEWKEVKSVCAKLLDYMDIPGNSIKYKESQVLNIVITDSQITFYTWKGANLIGRDLEHLDELIDDLKFFEQVEGPEWIF